MKTEFEVGFLMGIFLGITLGLGLGLSSNARAADDVWIGFGGVSHHEKREPDDNERNFGLGVQVGLTDNVRFIAQGFRNTNRVDSTLIGFSYQPWRYTVADLFDVRPGAVIAQVTGYDPDAMLVVFPVVSFEGKRFGLDYILTREKEDKGLVHGLNFKVKW